MVVETRKQSAKRRFLELPKNCRCVVEMQAVEQTHAARKEQKNQQMKVVLTGLDNFFRKLMPVIVRFETAGRNMSHLHLPEMLFNPNVVRILEREKVPVKTTRKNILTYFDEKSYRPNQPKSQLMYALLNLLWEAYIDRVNPRTMNISEDFPAYNRTFRRHFQQHLASIDSGR
tara:strand:- start:170 stop:688 length:519 start_codon:yes stop_codon:yes gene_type:complete